MAGHRATPAPQGSPWRALVTTAGTVAGGVLVYAVAPMAGRFAWIGLLLGLGALGVIVPLTVRRARRVRWSDRPIIDAAETLVLLFTLLVLGFASGYVVLGQEPGELVDVTTKVDALYFTLATLSTVGFGDAHASGQTARLVVSVQIVVNLVFIATVVRLLTSVAHARVAERSARADEDHPPT